MINFLFVVSCLRCRFCSLKIAKAITNSAPRTKKIPINPAELNQQPCIMQHLSNQKCTSHKWHSQLLDLPPLQLFTQVTVQLCRPFSKCTICSLCLVPTPLFNSCPSILSKFISKCFSGSRQEICLQSALISVLEKPSHNQGFCSAYTERQPMFTTLI